MIYPFYLVMNKLQGTHEWLYQLYLASPLCQAVLLNDRAFWLPTVSDPEADKISHFPEHLFERGVIMILVGLVFLWFAQMTFSRLEGRFAEKL